MTKPVRQVRKSSLGAPTATQRNVPSAVAVKSPRQGNVPSTSGGAVKVTRKPPACSLDRKVADLRVGRAPVAVADEEGDAADRFCIADPDPAELAVLQRRRDRPGGEHPPLRRRLLGSIELDRPFVHFDAPGPSNARRAGKVPPHFTPRRPAGPIATPAGFRLFVLTDERRDRAAGEHLHQVGAVLGRAVDVGEHARRVDRQALDCRG